MGFFLQPPYPLQNFVSILFAPGFEQGSRDLGQAALKLLSEPVGHGGFFFLPCLGMTVQTHFRTILADHPLEMDCLAGGGGNVHGLRQIKLAGPLAADDQIAIVMTNQPADIGLGGDAPVHDHQGADRCVKPLEHLFQSGGLGNIAVEHPRTPDKTAAVQHQPQGHQRAIAAFFLRMPALGLGIGLHLAFKIGVGQVKEGHGRGQGKKIVDSGKQSRFNGLAMPDQQVGGPIEVHQRHGFKIDIQQLAQATALPQPVPGSQFAGWRSHPPNNSTHDRRPLFAAQACFFEDAGQFQPGQGRKTGMLDPDGTGTDQLQALDIHLMIFGRDGLLAMGRASDTSRAAYRWARASIALGTGARLVCPEIICSIRVHSTGHCSRGKENVRPRFSRVCCRTLPPIRFEATSRKVK